MKQSLSNKILDFFKTIFIACILAFLVRSLCLEPFEIPSSSMKPTLLIGDFLFVTKYSYGYSRYSFFPIPDSWLPKGRIFVSLPKRGDVVVFRKPHNTGINYIKRIVGIPGDRIQMIDGVLYVNKIPVTLKSIANYQLCLSDGQLVSVPQFQEILPNEGHAHHIIQIDSNHGPLSQTPMYIVPRGSYFMMGDNRDNSADSRVMQDVGYVPFDNIVGKAQFIWFSVDQNFHWMNPFSWFFNVRFSRIFRRII